MVLRPVDAAQAWELPLASMEELKVLVRERETLLHTLTQERNHLHALNHKARSMTWSHC